MGLASHMIHLIYHIANFSSKWSENLISKNCEYMCFWCKYAFVAGNNWDTSNGIEIGDELFSFKCANIGINDIEGVQNLNNWICQAEKKLIPIESNPQVFTQYTNKLGFKLLFEIQEFYSLKPDKKKFIPRSILSLVFLYENFT